MESVEVSYFSIWIYVVFGIVFFILSTRSWHHELRKEYGFYAFLMIYVFAIFRFNIGNDYPEYWNIVSTAPSDRDYFEPLSGGIINLVRLVDFPPLVFIIFSSISLFSYKYVIEKCSDDPVMSWYFYFAYPMLFFQDCSTIRQAGAMGLFFLAFYFVDQGKAWKSFGCLLIAVLFHKSALICFLIFFLPLFKRIGLKQNVVFFIMTFFAGNLIEIVVVNYLSSLPIAANFLYYLNQEFGGLNLFSYVMYFINIINFLLYRQLVEDNARNRYLITLVNVGLCLFNLFLIESQTAIRFANFFMLFELLLIPSYLNILSNFIGSRHKANLMVVSVLLMLQLTMVIIYIRAYNNQLLDLPVYVPYETWLNHL